MEYFAYQSRVQKKHADGPGQLRVVFDLLLLRLGSFAPQMNLKSLSWATHRTWCSQKTLKNFSVILTGKQNAEAQLFNAATSLAKRKTISFLDFQSIINCRTVTLI